MRRQVCQRGTLKHARRSFPLGALSPGIRLEQVDHGLVPMSQREIERRLVVIRSRLLRSSMREEQFQNFHISILRGGVEGCPTGLLADIHVGAVRQQDRNDIEVPSGSGGVQRRVLHGIARSGVNVGAVGQEDLRASVVSEERSEVKRSPAVVAVAPHQRAIVCKQAHNTLSDAGHRSRVDVELRAFVEQQLSNGILTRIASDSERAQSVFVGRIEQTGVGLDHLRNLGVIARADSIEKIVIHASCRIRSSRRREQLFFFQQFPAEVIHIE
jgi:hypothetical protein